jgi:hypothetical protein
MIGLFRLYALDNGTLIVVCGKCGYHLVITKETLDEARKHTVLGEVEQPNELTI